MDDAPTVHDLVVIGSTAAGLSVAVDAQRAGLRLVRIIAEETALPFPELVSERQLDVGYGESIESIDCDGSLLFVKSSKQTYRTRACLLASRLAPTDTEPPIPVTMVTSEGRARVLVNALPAGSVDDDVLVVGFTDQAVELTAALAAAGNRVVLAGGGMNPDLLSPAGDAALRRLERERRATLLYRSVPDQIGEVEGYPMAFFNDRRTPDLQFDHVVFASGRTAASPESLGVTAAAKASGALWVFGQESERPVGENTEGVSFAPGWDIWNQMSAAAFPELEPLEPVSPADRRRRHTSAIDELRAEHYNATITTFEPSHSDLWILRVKPDVATVSHLPGQYASLGLGYWEGRIDEAEDPGIDTKWEKLIRRSYSISGRMFDENGYLVDDTEGDELEFYIVLVPPTPENTPALTPRLALKRPGDRIYLGPKVAGRYTTASVIRPSDTLLFFSTGTGEAPHNAMVVEMLRKGHSGPIVSAVSVRKWADLGYREKHETLASRYANYQYVPLPTREPDVPKRYIQDLIASGTLETEMNVALNAESTHVFLCGNPAMIGLPEDEDGVAVYPDPPGVVGLLVDRGFTIDRRTERGNIHFEEYW